MKLTCLLSFILSVTLLNSCHKSPEVVAPGLNKPKGTLSFIFDTKYVEMIGGSAYYEWDSVKKVSNEYIMAYNAIYQDPKNVYIGLSDDPQSRGSVKAFGASPFIKAGFSFSLIGDSAYYSGIAGSITITRFDTLRKFMSGTFEGYAVRMQLGITQTEEWGIDSFPYIGDTIHIQSGKFDLPLKVKYIEYPPQ